MGQTYWLQRQQSALDMANTADAAQTRLVHYELAGHYSIRAAQSAAAQLLPPLADPFPPRIVSTLWPDTAENDR
jgi:hypothetical protein